MWTKYGRRGVELECTTHLWSIYDVSDVSAKRKNASRVQPCQRAAMPAASLILGSVGPAVALATARAATGQTAVAVELDHFSTNLLAALWRAVRRGLGGYATGAGPTRGVRAKCWP